MAGIVEEKKAEVAKEVQKVVPVPGKTFVSVVDAVPKVLELDTQGVELFFEHEKGRFLRLADADIKRLHHDNQVRYSMSAALNEKHDPENDALQNKLKVTQANERRRQFESVVKSTSQSARATKKLQAFVGEGYEPRWSRPDKIEERLEKGYEIVEPTSEVYAGVQATEGHFETRVKPGETEMVLMRVRKDVQAKLKADLAEQARKLDVSADNFGRETLKGMGAKLVDQGQGGAWQDR